MRNPILTALQLPLILLRVRRDRETILHSHLRALNGDVSHVFADDAPDAAEKQPPLRRATDHVTDHVVPGHVTDHVVPGHVTDQESIRTEDIEREYRKVLVQPGESSSLL